MTTLQMIDSQVSSGPPLNLYRASVLDAYPYLSFEEMSGTSSTFLPVLLQIAYDDDVAAQVAADPIYGPEIASLAKT
jgi:hypothetical protein